MKTLPTALALALTVGTVAFADDTARIFDVITDIAAGADRHDWPRVRDAFADQVTLDYTGLWGGEPTTQNADDVVAGWSGFLPGFDITHHMVTNKTVTALDDRSAMAEADFTATHRIDNAFWVLGGRYHYELAFEDDAWRVSALTMTPLWETGSRDLVTQAAARAAAN